MGMKHCRRCFFHLNQKSDDEAYQQRFKKRSCFESYAATTNVAENEKRYSMTNEDSIMVTRFFISMVISDSNFKLSDEKNK